MTRDPKRIPRILAVLEEAWQLHPDWRLGQLLVNLLPPECKEDLFYLEDEEFEGNLRTVPNVG